MDIRDRPQLHVQHRSMLTKYRLSGPAMPAATVPGRKCFCCCGGGNEHLMAVDINLYFGVLYGSVTHTFHHGDWAPCKLLPHYSKCHWCPVTNVDSQDNAKKYILYPSILKPLITFFSNQIVF